MPGHIRTIAKKGIKLYKQALIIIAAITLYACHQNPAKQKKPDTISHQKHWVKITPQLSPDFDAFFKQFENDRTTHLSQVRFPLKIVYKTDYSDSEKIDSVEVIDKKDWHFSKTKTKGLIITKIHTGPNEVHVLYQVQDTGIYTVYFFMRVGASWQLDHIEDSSD